MYAKEFQESIHAVEAARAANIAYEPARMTADEKDALLAAYHPDYKKSEFATLQIGPNKGESVPHELCEMLQAHSRISAKDVDLSDVRYDVDVLIIGGGGAGASAAIEADNAGAKTMIVTKLRIGDANTMMAEGGIQAADKPNDSPAIHFLDAFGGGHFAAKRELLAKLVCDAPEAIQWLNDLGVEFDKAPDGTMITTHGGGTSRKRMHAAKDYSGAEIMRTLRDEVLNRGIPVVDFTAAIELILDEQGKAAGAVLMNMETHELMVARAKTVIIATGGSTGNVYFRTMIDARRGVEYDCTSGDPFCPKDASGEIAAMAIGACLGDIANQVIGDSFLTKAAMIGTQYTDSFATVQPTSPLFKLSRATGLRVYDWSNLLQVNMLGERFANETDSSTNWNGAALASVLTVDPSDGELHRYGGPLWTIFDSKAVEREGWVIDDTTVDREDGRFFEADTLEELAEKVVNKYYEQIKMDPEALVATVKRYNELVDKGTDEDFGKEGMTDKIETGPFYAAWSTPGFHDCTTGLRVNRKMQVMDLFGQVIPGLYCGGESSGGMRIHGLGRVITTGYIAGLCAATEE